MIYKDGWNYHFFLATPNSIARLQSERSPFYPFLKKKIPELPSLSSEPVIIPRFLYSVRWNRESYLSEPYKLPRYPFSSEKEEGLLIPIPLSKGNVVQLERSKRTRYGFARYLSLRDFVNPELSEEQVIDEIESLYFDAQKKNFLFRLVKILYSGTPSEEYTIVSNLFTYEIDFANFLKESMFSIEILPLIHGPFLQEILRKIDERILKFEWNHLSKPIQEVVKKSISKNKLSMVMDSPPKKPEEGDSLVDLAEREIYRRFARKIYFEDGNYTAYRFPEDSDATGLASFVVSDSKAYQLWSTSEKIQYLFRTEIFLYFRILEWTEIIRFDYILSLKDWEPVEFHKIPPNLILEVPLRYGAKCLIGAGITRDREAFEFALQWREA